MSIYKKSLSIAVAVSLGLLLSACLPKSLDKYRKNKRGTSSSSNDVTLMDQSIDTAPSPGSTLTQKNSAVRSTASAQPARRQASIYAIDQKTFRFKVKDGDVWNSALNVLMRNYNVTVIDRKNGIVTTEWDTYYLGNEVYRNKISMRMSRSSYSNVDLTIHNNVEKLRDASQAAGTVGAVWLPADDKANETARIVQNMALLLGQPPPILPPGMAVAKDVLGDEVRTKR